jgi:hypothetical protein
MALPLPPADRLFNNADSFAQVFDEAWKRLGPSAGDADQRLQSVLEQLADHPFALAEPELARQVGEFRIRLLDL